MRASLAVYGGLGRFSKETSPVFSDAVEQWRKELRSDPRWAAEGLADVFSIEIKLTDLDDPALRTKVLGIPAALRISEEARGPRWRPRRSRSLHR